MNKLELKFKDCHSNNQMRIFVKLTRLDLSVRHLVGLVGIVVIRS